MEIKLTVRCQHDFHECLVHDFRGRTDHLKDVVGVVIVTEEQETIGEMINAIVWNLRMKEEKYLSNEIC